MNSFPFFCGVILSTIIEKDNELIASSKNDRYPMNNRMNDHVSSGEIRSRFSEFGKRSVKKNKNIIPTLGAKTATFIFFKNP
jgi:hypothetical protein